MRGSVAIWADLDRDRQALGRRSRGCGFVCMLVCTLVCVRLCIQELGDLENWAKTIEGDMNNISSALEYVYKSNLPAVPPTQDE